MKLKLFVWTEFYSNYTDHDGIAFAIAETMEEAQEIISKDQGHEILDWGDIVQTFPIAKIGFSVICGD